MADSDYDYEEDASDDEYIGAKSASSSRAQASEKRKTQEKPAQVPAFLSRRSPGYTVPVMEAEDGTIQRSVQEREEERKRKR